ncbi:Coilin [Habropoda laboriosa]|uniref:Coilin n=1 Tax=Habropoda laboriosa TaxID=597456 RepID=A0A0L7RJ21_9HYME|nr:Coilin [Habropoda laboriosa]
MSPSNFRIKLNLDKFYDDVRRYCWVFIDGTKMLKINHVMEHIMKLFKIKQPFHLLLNETEYLPPNEDIRILKENETILVSPGSGLDIGLELCRTILKLPEDESFIQSKRNTNTVQHKQLQANLSPILSNPVPEIVFNKNTNLFENDIPDITMVSNEIESSEIAIRDEVAINTMENMTCPKRIRARRKKKEKKNTQRQEIEEDKSRKPRIADIRIIPSGKHIRFDNTDHVDITEKEVDHAETVNGSNTPKLSPPWELANLLSLGQNSTPLTFTNKKVKKPDKVEPMFEEETQSIISPDNKNENTVLNKKLEEENTNKEVEEKDPHEEVEGKNPNKNIKEEKNPSSKDYESYPLLTEKPKVKDIIAFKMLKIGSDWTPQVSNFIEGEVLSYYPLSSLYTLKVLQGLSELQVPVGKFTIIEKEEERIVNDTITLNYSQIMTPRIVSTCNSSSDTPTNCVN